MAPPDPNQKSKKRLKLLVDSMVKQYTSDLRFYVKDKNIENFEASRLDKAKARIAKMMRTPQPRNQAIALALAKSKSRPQPTLEQSRKNEARALFNIRTYGTYTAPKPQKKNQ